VVKYIGECRELGISVQPPDVQISGSAVYAPARRAGDSFGLAAVKNVGGNAIESILKARDGSWRAVQELLGVLREG
jgi:DNA polymerase-3 subunit alpha